VVLLQLVKISIITWTVRTVNINMNISDTMDHRITANCCHYSICTWLTKRLCLLCSLKWTTHKSSRHIRVWQGSTTKNRATGNKLCSWRTHTLWEFKPTYHHRHFGSVCRGYYSVEVAALAPYPSAAWWASPRFLLWTWARCNSRE